MTTDDYEFTEKISDIIDRDDPADLVKLYHEYPGELATLGVEMCAIWKAKKCLTALVSGEVCEPPLALEGCATIIHIVAWYFPDPDVITIMLSRGAIMDLNIKCHVHNSYGTPLHLLLDALSSGLHMHLQSWSPVGSVFKLIILLCQWETKHRLDAARKFVPNTDSVIGLAWTYLRDGKLMQLAALLLVARKEVMVPLKTGKGTTIRQAAMDLINLLSSESNVDHQYKSILMDACKLFDVFERAGDALSLYIRLMNKHIPVDKVLVDVVCILKNAGFSLRFADVDLRDCYRELPKLWNDELFNLLDIPRPGSAQSSLLYPTTSPGSAPLGKLLFEARGRLSTPRIRIGDG